MHPRLVHAHELSAIIRVVGKSSLGYTGSHIYTHIYIYTYNIKEVNSIIPRFRSWLNRVTTAESGWFMGTKWPAPSTRTCSSVHPAPVIVLVGGWIIQESEKKGIYRSIKHVVTYFLDVYNPTVCNTLDFPATSVKHWDLTINNTETHWCLPSNMVTNIDFLQSIQMKNRQWTVYQSVKPAEHGRITVIK